jgi:hypothetical protein
LDHINSKIHDHKKLFFSLTLLIGDTFLQLLKEKYNCEEELNSTEDPGER